MIGTIQDRCRTCRAPVYFAWTDPKQCEETGAKAPAPSLMPVDVDPTPNGNLFLVYRRTRLGEVRLVATAFREGKHDPERRRQSHFVSCPQANDWRKKQMNLELR
jgi:hypothetical protein